jgi:hypothetical protein
MLLRDLSTTMTEPIDLSNFYVPLGQSAHQQAAYFSQAHPYTQKSEQVYLNTLAVYAVNYYLQCIGFTTDLNSSDSWDLTMQTLGDVADLTVQNYGRIECRPVDAGATIVQIPAEVWQDRIGYLIVELDESLDTAQLLGFLEQVNTMEVPLEKLQPLDQLAAHLSRFQQTQVDFAQWLVGRFTEGWRALEEIMTYPQAEQALAFRNTPEAVTRSKHIELEQGQSAIEMIVTLNPTSDQDREIQVEVIPSDGQHYLPASLQLTLLDEQGGAIIDAQTRDENQRMRLEFDGTVGDQFSLRVALKHFSITENFII